MTGLKRGVGWAIVALLVLLIVATLVSDGASCARPGCPRRRGPSPAGVAEAARVKPAGPRRRERQPPARAGSSGCGAGSVEDACVRPARRVSLPAAWRRR